MQTVKAGQDGLIAEPCDNKTDGHWYCVTHAKHFANPMQLDLHLGKRGPHYVGWWCNEHGLEQP